MKYTFGNILEQDMKYTFGNILKQGMIYIHLVKY